MRIFTYIILLTLVSCTYSQKIQTGEEAFAFQQYAVAAQMLNEEYKESSNIADKANKAFLLAESYKFMNENAQALRWYKRAEDHNFGEKASNKYALALKEEQRYNEAYEKFDALSLEYGNLPELRRQKTACLQASEWLSAKSESPYSVSLGNFNTADAEYAPVYFGPNNIIFSSDRLGSTGNQIYNWTGRRFSDFFIYNTYNNTVQRFDNRINSEHNEGSICFSSDLKNIYFTRCYSEESYDYYCQIFYAEQKNGSWSNPIPMPFTKQEINYGHPSLSKNDSILFFSSDDPSGFGGFDIYASFLEEEGWGEPLILSDRINSLGDELFPYMHEDTLYFSSDYLVGMGGLDIFKSNLKSNGDWTAPINLKSPINSGSDDFAFRVNDYEIPTGDVIQTGLFSSTRSGGQGSDDIYQFEKVRKKQSLEEEIASKKDPKKEYQVILALRVFENVRAIPTDVKSAVQDKIILSNEEIILEQGGVQQVFKTNEKGLIITELDFDANYFIEASSLDYFKNVLNFSTSELERDPENTIITINKTLELDKILRNTEITLENIYYDLDKSFIRNDAKPTLNELAKMLKENPSIDIQLSSHTDCQGEDDYNQELSQKRAKAAVDYLISIGISSARLKALGYGETRPARNCNCNDCSDEEHQENRRTTFKIL